MLNSDLVDALTRVTGALSLLAAYKIGSGGGWTRARQRLARSAVGARGARPSSGRGSTSPHGPREKPRRPAARLRLGVAAVAVALLLSILAYAEFKGDGGFAGLEAVGLVRVAR